MLRLSRFFKRRDERGAVEISHEDLNPDCFPISYCSEGGIKVRHDHDGITVSHPDGTEYTLGADGRVRGKLRSVESVTIADLAQVVSHQITQVHETVSHVVHIDNGGTLCYLVNLDGRLMDCELDQLNLVFGACSHVIVGCTDVVRLIANPTKGEY